MSTLWTPDGERPIRRAEPAGPEPSPAADVDPAGRSANGGEGPNDAALTGEDRAMEADMARMQEELAAAPAEVVVANHAVGLFNLAGLHLSQQPPHLGQARLAIDALSALLEGLEGRLGSDEPALRDGLAQLRMAFVQISAAHRGGTPEEPQA